MVVGGLSQTKNWYLPETDIIKPSERDMNGLQIWYDIPWHDIYSTGWQMVKDNTWGQENKMVLKPQPEFFAPGNLIRGNGGGLPSVNTNDPIYQYKRQNATVILIS